MHRCSSMVSSAEKKAKVAEAKAAAQGALAAVSLKKAKEGECPETAGAPSALQPLSGAPKEPPAKVAKTSPPTSPAKRSGAKSAACSSPPPKVAKASPPGSPATPATKLAATLATSSGSPAKSAPEPTVPSLRPPSDTAAASQQPWPRWQDPGNEGAASVKTYHTVRSLLPWVRQELPAAVRKLGETCEGAVEGVAPLKIGKNKDKTLSNYKEVWTPANCKTSIATTGMYEAGGSLMWLDPGFHGEHVPMLQQEPQWPVLVQYQEQFFSRTACGPAEDVPEQASGLGRLVFPMTLEAYETDLARDWAVMPRHLSLLAGQPMLLAWYLAAVRALQASDNALLLQLWQAALTCTIKVTAAASVGQLALSAVFASEKYLKLAEMTDTWFHWSTKVQKIIDDMDEKHQLSGLVLTKQLADKGVRYRGALVNKHHVYSVGHVHELFDEQCLGVLRTIENEFGRNVLSVDYTKLRSYLTTVKSAAPGVSAPNKLKEVPTNRTHPPTLPAPAKFMN